MAASSDGTETPIASIYVIPIMKPNDSLTYLAPISTNPPMLGVKQAISPKQYIIQPMKKPMTE